MSMRNIVMIEQNVKDKEKNLKSYKKIKINCLQRNAG